MSLERPKIWVKVCGITSLGDALAAMGAGADLLGFNFAPLSPRKVTVEKVTAILKEAPKGFLRVGVFQNAPVEDVVNTVKTLGLHYVQLHGQENAADYVAAGVPIIQAFSVSSPGDIAKAEASSADLLLLDSKSALGGGSGQAFPWHLAQNVSRKYFVAGGLRPDNVEEVILKLQPYGVDVASGVEKEPGKKDRHLLKAFLQAARSAEERVFSQVRGR